MQRAALVFGLSLWLGGAGLARADANIVVDGHFNDWPSDAWSFLDAAGDNPSPFADLERVMVTDNNTQGSNGNLFVALDFTERFQFNVGSNDIDVFLYLDIDGDGQIGGPLDRVLELTSMTVRDGAGNLLGSFPQRAVVNDRMEIRVPYTLLGLSHGSDTFGLAFAVTGHPGGIIDHAPEPGQGDHGFIVYDGTVGDDIQPLAVSLLEARARLVPEGVELLWTTGSERLNAGFRVDRRSPDGQRVRLSPELVPGLVDAPVGRVYRFMDPAGRPGDAYQIEDVDLQGRRTRHPPVVAGVWRGALSSPRPEVLKASGSPREKAARVRARPGETAQVEVREPGLHLLTAADLEALGLAPLAGPSLERASGPVPALALRGGWLFMGAPQVDRWAELEVVRVRPGPGPGMPARPVQGGCVAPWRSTVETRTLEENREYYVAAPGPDPFFWGSAFPGYPAELAFDLPGLLAGPAELRVRVVGLGPGAHRLEARLNGCELGEASFTGPGPAELQLLPGKCLIERGNRLVLAVPVDAGWDGLFLDVLEVSAPFGLVARADRLEFSAPAGACLELTGFSGEDVVLLDVSAPHAPVALTGFGRARAPDGSVSLRILDPVKSGGAARRYLAARPSAARRPTPRAPMGSCRALTPGGALDSLIVTHPSLLAAAERLAGLHATRGLRPWVVTTRQLEDCFAFGRPGPAGVRAFFDAVLGARPGNMRFAVLLGGATVDPRGFLPGSPPDLVPTPLERVGPEGYEAASDGWYAAGPDGLSPRLALGRLPARSLGEAHALVDKLARGFAQAPGPAPRLVVVADSRDPGLAEPVARYQGMAETLVALCAPENTRVDRVFKAQEAEPREALSRALAAGPDLAVYFGHAYLSGWSSGPVMADLGLAAALENPRLFHLLSFTCFDGAFAGPWAESLAWAMVANPAGGALSAIASSSLSDPAVLEVLARRLVCGLHKDGLDSLGEVFQAAEADLAAGRPEVRDLVRTFNLLGDPTTPNPWR
jgi:hypothetical protein